MSAEKMINYQSYLSFRLGEELFTAIVDKVFEIVKDIIITKVPKSPPCMATASLLLKERLPEIGLYKLKLSYKTNTD